ncbi:MAG: WD40 repeat domain-containing protein [Ferruginibacter sp.]
MVFLLLTLLIIIGVLAYVHFIYQPPKVDSGFVKLRYTFSRHTHIVTGVRFTPNDSLLITGSVDSTLMLWNRATGAVIRTIRQPGGITYLDLSTDGNFVVTGSYDGIVRIWNISNGALMQELKGSKGTVWTVAFSSDGKFVAASGDDRDIKIWRTETGELMHTLKGHKRIVWSVKFSPDGRTLASASYDYSLKLWNVADGKLLRDNHEHKETVVDIAFSHNGKMLASTSDDCTIKLWNTAGGSLIRSMKVPEHVQAVAFSPDDTLLMTGGRDKTMAGELVQNFFGTAENNKGVSARLWDVSTGTLLHSFTHHNDDVMDIAYSHDGRWIATASADKTVDVWEVSSLR